MGERSEKCKCVLIFLSYKRVAVLDKEVKLSNLCFLERIVTTSDPRLVQLRGHQRGGLPCQGVPAPSKPRLPGRLRQGERGSR